MIRALTFDIGGTLADGGLDKRAFARKAIGYLCELGYDVSVRAYKRALDGAMKALMHARASGREMDFYAFYSRVLEGLGIEPSRPILDGLLDLYFNCFAYTVKPGVRAVLEALSGQFKLGVISNAISPWPRRFLELEGLDKYFSTVVISGEVGWRKPHKRIFELALSELGVRPEEAVHIGNSPEEDVFGAKSAGMWAILLAWEEVPEELEVQPDVIVSSISELPGALEELAEGLTP